MQPTIKKSTGKFPPGNFLKSPSVKLILWLFWWMLAASCTQSSKPEYQLLKIYGNGPVANYTKTNILSFTECSLGAPGGIMAEKSDLLWLSSWAYPLSSKQLKNKNPIRFYATDSFLILDNKLAGLRIDTPMGYRQLILGMDTPAIKGLTILTISEAGCKMHRQALEKIARLNPTTDLVLEDELPDETFKWLMVTFNPRFLSAVMTQSQFAMLQSEQQLNNLHISLAPDSNFSCQPIPSLHHLKNLSINGEEAKSVSVTDQLLKHNPQVEYLILTGFEDGNISGVLKTLTNLRELVLLGVPISASEVLAHKATIQRALIDSFALQTELPNIRWGTLGSNSESGSLLDSLAKRHPSLEVLEVFANSEPMSLASLSQFSKLKALSLTDADSIDLNPVKTMKQLRLLSYSTDNGNDDSTLSVLKSSLPNTLVVANDGLCVGSGWLAIWIPVLALTIALAKRKFT